MKRSIIVAVLCFTLLCGFTLGTTGALNNTSLAEADVNTDDMGTLYVNGEGIVKIKPDVAYINLGVECENKVSQKAQEENAKKMAAVVESLKEQGIKENDVKTISYDIRTLRYYNEKTHKSETTGYRVENVVQVTINNINNVGKVIDAVSEKGANLIRNIRFGTTKQDEYYLQALKIAMDNAKGKANVLAESIGVVLKKPSKISENSYGGYTMIDANDSYRANSMKKFESIETSISSGELEIRANVNIEYKY